MKVGIPTLVLLALLPTSSVLARSSYTSLAEWADQQASSLERLSGKPAPSSFLRGYSPKAVTLLQDGLLHKHPRLLGNSRFKAQRLIERLYDRRQINVLRGEMAEALFIDRNPGWNYVGKPNAPQHDVYRLVQGRRAPLTGQIKFHTENNPALYARDMAKDFRSPRFFIPDDHVAATKDYLSSTGRWRDLRRVRPLGATSLEIATATRLAAGHRLRFLPIAAAIPLAFGQLLLEPSKNQDAFSTSLQSAEALSILMAGHGSELLTRSLSPRTRIRLGPTIAVAAMMLAEAVWLAAEHGWREALVQPAFYRDLASSATGLAMGYLGFEYGTWFASPTGFWAPVIGTAVGVVTGVLGYLAGRDLLDLFFPGQSEQERINLVRRNLDLKMELAGSSLGHR